jgi:hypothetical protein
MNVVAKNNGVRWSIKAACAVASNKEDIPGDIQKGFVARDK